MILSQHVQTSQPSLPQPKGNPLVATQAAGNRSFLDTWSDHSVETEQTELPIEPDAADLEVDIEPSLDGGTPTDSTASLGDEHFADAKEGANLDPNAILLGQQPEVPALHLPSLPADVPHNNAPNVPIESVDAIHIQRSEPDHTPNTETSLDASLQNGINTREANELTLPVQSSETAKSAQSDRIIHPDTHANRPTNTVDAPPRIIGGKNGLLGHQSPLGPHSNPSVETMSGDLPKEGLFVNGPEPDIADRSPLTGPQLGSVGNHTATSAVSLNAAIQLPATPQLGKIVGLNIVEQDVQSSMGQDEPLAEIGLPTSVSTPQLNMGVSMANVVKSSAPTVVQQIAATLEQSSGQSTQISLNPDELGRIRISLSSSEAGLVVNIVAERPETADLMRRNIDSLLQDFSDLGYDNPSFDFQNDNTHDEDSSSDSRSKSPDAPSVEVTLNQPQLGVSQNTKLGGLDLKL